MRPSSLPGREPPPARSGLRAHEVRLRRRVVLGALLFAVPILGVLAMLDQAERARAGAEDQRRASGRALALVNELEKTVIDMETGGRGYILTRDESFLAPLNAAIPRHTALLDALRGDRAVDPAARRIIERLDGQVTAFVQVWELPLVALARTDPTAARALVVTQGGKRRMDSIRSVVADFRREASVKLDALDAQETELASRARLQARVGAVLCAGLLLMYVVFICRWFVAPVERLAAAARRTGDGDHSARVAASSFGEVRRLEDAFNEMADRIEASQAELEAQASTLQEQAAELEEQGESLAQVNAVLAEEQAATERFFRFGQRLVEDSHLRRLAERLVGDMATMARADVGTVHGPDPSAPQGDPMLLATLALDPTGVGERVTPAVGPGGRALAEQHPVVLAHADTGLVVRVMGGTAAVRHELHLPLVVLGRPLGVVALGRVRDEPFAKEDVDLLGALAEQAAVVVSHAAALAEARRHATIIGATLRANVDGIALFDGAGRNLLLNDSAAEIYTEMLGRDARATFTHQGLFVDADLIAARVLDPVGFLEGFARARAASVTEPVTSEFTMRDSGRTFRRHAMPVEDDEGHELGRLFILRELTLERQAERYKDELIATVSHELRTPLTSIVGYAEMLEEPDLAPEETTRFATTIRRQGVRLTALVDNLLDLQQIGSGVSPAERRPVDLAMRLTEQAELFRAQSRSHRIVLVLGDPELSVLADERTVDQVVANLLSNAVKYSPDGGDVTIRALRGEGVVRVSVSDQGIGIPEAEHGRVFSQFFRAEAVVGSTIRGTGLGLALVREMIQAQDGRVGFDSQVGAGSTFWFEIPAVALVDRPAHQAA